MDPCCWQKEQLAPEDCPFLHDGEEVLRHDRRRRILERCIKCPRLVQELSSGAGLADLLQLLEGELQQRHDQLQYFARQLDSKVREIGFLHDVSLVLQSSVDMNEVIAMALTAITAGKGFGFNRAMLLLVDKAGTRLDGYMAVGPTGGEEAQRIWQEIEDHDYSLREMARLFVEQKMAAEREKFSYLLGRLSVPLDRREHLFTRTLLSGISVHLRDVWAESALDFEQKEALGVGELLLVPLLSKNRQVGLLLADNIINRQPMSDDDLQSLETFAAAVSFAIERTTLYERLQEELDHLADANVRLLEQQGMIGRMERLAVLGQIAADLTHSVRNPLTIIGGYARILLRQTPTELPQHRFLEAMVREARRLEEAVQDVVAHTEELHPTVDLWDVNRILAGIHADVRDDLALCRVECSLELDPLLPPAPMDLRQMTHCLRFLLNRAIEGMPDGGRLTVRTGLVGEEIEICIGDNGPGMNRDEMATVFAPFFSGRHEGHAVGLTLCAKVLKEHQAFFAIDSHEGEGTTYRIRLKLTREDAHDTTAGG